MRIRLAVTVITLATLGLSTPAQSQGNRLDQAMLFRSFVQDAPTCSAAFAEGRPGHVPDVTSPAATCPDAFAWFQLLTAIQEEFWTWGTDQTTWPVKPLPMCGSDLTENCCDPADFDRPSSKTPPSGCPYDRAEYPGESPIVAVPAGEPSRVIINHGPLTTVEQLDPGRLLRDLELEIVFRNTSMIRYLFVNDLYNREGLGARVTAMNKATADVNLAAAHELEVRLPTDATMVKVDFVHQSIMEAEKLIQSVDNDGRPLDPPNNPEYPYLTAWFEGPTGPDDPNTGYYYLLAMTNSSKALPGWHWYAIEHVANRGRCDYIGCNDSFGYRVNRTYDGGVFGTHFIPPMTRLENDRTRNNDPIFVTGKLYDPAVTGEVMTDALAALYRAFDVGTAQEDMDPKALAPKDPAWRNYRLKGTQTAFTTNTGVPTGTGATITEGGFVNSASCMTCHSQATVDATGGIGIGGVGSTWRPNLMGFSQVVMGAPDLDWFFDPGTTTYDAVQIDFIWGILNAQCINPATSGNGCESYPSSPRSH